MRSAFDAQARRAPTPSGGRSTPASSSARGTRPFSRWKWSVRAEPVCSDGERGRDVARGLSGLGADRGQRVGVLLLRHQRARAAVRVGELDQAELLARVDLEVLRRAARGASRRSRASRAARRRRPHCHAASFACSTSPSQPSSSARRSRSSGQREPALPPAPATLRESSRWACAAARRRAAPGRRRPAAGGRPSSAGPAAGRCSRPRARSRSARACRRGRRRSRRARRAARRRRGAHAGARPTRNASRRGRPALSQPAAVASRCVARARPRAS